jgi:hypothetical protein
MMVLRNNKKAGGNTPKKAGIKRPPENSEKLRRYFIFQGTVSMQRFKEEVKKRGIGAGDTVYLSPGPDRSVSEFEGNAPKTSIFDLTKYNSDSIVREAQSLGYEVVRIEQ